MLSLSTEENIMYEVTLFLNKEKHTERFHLLTLAFQCLILRTNFTITKLFLAKDGSVLNAELIEVGKSTR